MVTLRPPNCYVVGRLGRWTRVPKPEVLTDRLDNDDGKRVEDKGGEEDQ